MAEFVRDFHTGLIVPASDVVKDSLEPPTPKPQVLKGDMARELAEELKRFKLMLNHSYMRAGEVLDKILTTRAYKHLDYKSFAAFLADPEYGMPKSTAYLYLHVYRFYAKELGFYPDDLADIDIVRLRDLIPIIRPKPEEAQRWIDMARVLGKCDFINALRHEKGKEDMEIMPKAPDEEEVVVIKSDYTELVKASECIICGKRPVDFHHFPRTKGAGADDDKVIPLCRWCHTAFHQDPKAMLWEHRVKVFDWFYKIIFGLLGIKDNSGVK